MSTHLLIAFTLSPAPMRLVLIRVSLFVSNRFSQNSVEMWHTGGGRENR